MDTFHISHFIFQWKHKNVNAIANDKKSLILSINPTESQCPNNFHKHFMRERKYFSEIADSYKLSAEWGIKCEYPKESVRREKNNVKIQDLLFPVAVSAWQCA